MKMKYLRNTVLGLWAICLVSCNKDWLDIKQNRKQVVPQTLADFQAMMDDTNTMNFGVFPIFGHISCDDYYLSTERWAALTDPIQKNSYVWAKDILGIEQSTDWNTMYKMVLYGNSAIFGIEKIRPNTADQAAWNNIQGSALFYRSWAFYQLAQLFCKQYTQTTAGGDAGIPLRLDADINMVSTRASVQAVYEQMIKDLQTAIPLLPVTSLVKTRPSKPAALALLSKVFLQIGDYQSAMEYANASLELHSTLIDYRKLDSKAAFPVVLFNEEVLFHSSTAAPTILIPTRLNVDTLLFRSYSDNDMRKKIFFYEDGKDMKYKGSYDGSRAFFGGIATDEVYLIRAEGYIRTGQIGNALKDLNKLLENRMDPFVAVSETDPKNILDLIIAERRKELVFRGIRWADLRRLNKEPRYETVMKRMLGTEITLLPGSLNYVLPIPKTVIELTGMRQNERE
jgi:tetratricopeptide (TPR) repeat protein